MKYIGKLGKKKKWKGVTAQQNIKIYNILKSKPRRELNQFNSHDRLNT